MDLIQSRVVHKVGRKWKSRWAVLRKIASNSDVLTLLFYKNAEHAKERRRVKHAVCLTDYCDSFKLSKIEKLQNILAIIMMSQTEFVSYENLETRDEWERVLQGNYGKEAEFRVTVPIKQKIKPGDACLGIYGTFFSLSSNSSCKAIGRWALEDLYRYAVIEGAFYFGVKKTGKRKLYLYSLSSDECDSIVQEFDEVIDKEKNDETVMVTTDLYGSGILDDLQRARRRSAHDHNFFQRTVLRMSNRMRRQRHKRSETFSGSNDKEGRDHSDSQTQIREGDAWPVLPPNDRIRCKERRPRNSLSEENRNERPSSAGANRSHSFGHFESNHGKVKSKSSSEILDKRRPLRSSESSSRSIAIARLDDIRGQSVSSDVFENDSTHNENGAQAKQDLVFNKIRTEGRGPEVTKSESTMYKADQTKESNNSKSISDGPPKAPPRSPISLTLFSFPSPDTSITSDDFEIARTYVNRDDVISGKDIDPPAGETGVVLRQKDSVSLLEEIDKEYKRRTNTSLMEGSSSVASVGSSRGSLEAENVKDSKGVDSDGTPHTGHQSFTDGPTARPGDASKNGENRIENGHEARKGGKSSIMVVNGEASARAQVGDRLRRESATKHLSDPSLLNRLIAAREYGAGSLSDLENRSRYGSQDGEHNPAGSYVNVAPDGSIYPSPGPKKGKPKKKPPPLETSKNQWAQYDDEDSPIYHRVGPLVSPSGSRSTEQINSYQNVVGYGSYENIAGRGMARDAAYVNVGKKQPTLNYVTISGANDTMNNMLSPRLHGPKSESGVYYTMIDEHATNLINKTRVEHQQRREEDAHSKMAKKAR